MAEQVRKLCCQIHPNSEEGTGRCKDCIIRKRKSYAWFRYEIATKKGKPYTFETLCELWRERDRAWKWRSSAKAGYAKESVLLLCKDLGLKEQI